jgi:hypothetical protein
MTTMILHYTNREGLRREWWFRYNAAGDGPTYAVDPPVTLCADPERKAREVMERAEQNGWTELSIETVTS